MKIIDNTLQERHEQPCKCPECGAEPDHLLMLDGPNGPDGDGCAIVCFDCLAKAFDEDREETGDEDREETGE